jgi:ribosome-associated protein
LNRSSEARKQAPTSEQLNDLIIDSIQDIKGKNVVKLDLRKLEDASIDYFIICEGDSSTQIQAIADNIYTRLKKEESTLPSHKEGLRSTRWVCLDYFSTVVHVFYPEARAFYGLEELWSDAEFVEYQSL